MRMNRMSERLKSDHEEGGMPRGHTRQRSTRKGWNNQMQEGREGRAKGKEGTQRMPREKKKTGVSRVRGKGTVIHREGTDRQSEGE